MKNLKIRQYASFIVLGLILLGFVGFVEKQRQGKSLQGTEVHIEGVSGLYFVDKEEIEELVHTAFPELKIGLKVDLVPLMQVEQVLKEHPFIKDADAVLGQKGILQLRVQQHQPIARIVSSTRSHRYITREGDIIPTSQSYTSRVLLLRGRGAEELLRIKKLSAEDPELFALIEKIRQSEFWNAQITEVELRSKTDIRLHQLVGKQEFLIGDASELTEKFERIQIFYDKVLPLKGWDAYKKVTVKYKDQLICE